jgi:hypothetical protein
MSTVEVPVVGHEAVVPASGPVSGGLCPPDTAVWLRTS